MIKGTADEQCAFRPKGNKKDQLLNLKIVIGKNREAKKSNTYLCFIDYRKALNAVDHKTLWIKTVWVFRKTLFSLLKPTLIKEKLPHKQNAILQTSWNLYNTYVEQRRWTTFDNSEGFITAESRPAKSLRIADNILTAG